MALKRIFVTMLPILAVTAAFAIDCYYRVQNADMNPTLLVVQGNSEIRKSIVLRDAMNSKYRVVDTQSDKFQWKGLSKSDRRELQGMLAQYLALINNVLEIGAHRNVTIEQKDILLAGRNWAEEYQKALERFEHEYGEGYDPTNSAKSLSLQANGSDGTGG
jgi:hypothetical protein